MKLSEPMDEPKPKEGHINYSCPRCWRRHLNKKIGEQPVCKCGYYKQFVKTDN